MREVGTVIGIVGLLIFAYLFASKPQLTTAAEGLASAFTGIISTLQGNGAGLSVTN